MVLEVKECCAIVCVWIYWSIGEKDGSSFPKAHCTVCSCLLLTQTWSPLLDIPWKQDALVYSLVWKQSAIVASVCYPGRDHSGGNEVLLKEFPGLAVYGGAKDNVPGSTQWVWLPKQQWTGGNHALLFPSSVFCWTKLSSRLATLFPGSRSGNTSLVVAVHWQYQTSLALSLPFLTCSNHYFQYCQW